MSPLWKHTEPNPARENRTVCSSFIISLWSRHANETNDEDDEDDGGRVVITALFNTSLHPVNWVTNASIWLNLHLLQQQQQRLVFLLRFLLTLTFHQQTIQTDSLFIPHVTVTRVKHNTNKGKSPRFLWMSCQVRTQTPNMGTSARLGAVISWFSVYVIRHKPVWRIKYRRDDNDEVSERQRAARRDFYLSYWAGSNSEERGRVSMNRNPRERRKKDSDSPTFK